MPESVGPCGILFENNNKRSLTDALRRALTGPPVPTDIRENHLAQYRSDVIARMFLQCMRHTIEEKSG